MISIRAATEDDLHAMCAVAARNGLSPTASDWEGFWSSNPYRGAFADVPTGWLMEEEGRPVGAVMNIHMMYDLAGQLIKGALGSAAAVDVPYRSKSVLLIGKFLRQKSAAFSIVGSANAAVTEICTVLARRIPSPDSDVPLLWPVDHYAFAGVVLKRKKVPGAGMLALPAGAALSIFEKVRRRRGSAVVHVDSASSFDEHFDALWERIRNGPPRLRAVRTGANLVWRFQREFREKRIRILTARKNGALCGYIVLVSVARSEFGMPVYEVADLQAVSDDSIVIRTLIVEALNVARSDGAGMLKFRAWNQGKRNVALELGAYSYRYPLWQAYYSTSNAGLAPALAASETWDFSPFEIF
jgi:hypothetical protein